MKLKSKLSFFAFIGIITILSFIFAILYLIINKKIGFTLFLFTFSLVSFSIVFYFMYQTYKRFADF
ncbi:MAG: hypothetical protein ABIL76_07065, partial [candidate division WOR-3 bacterium]